MRHLYTHSRLAFSLIEVLIAMLVLGIGLLMVAAIFPVAGNWTRQSAEEGMAQSVARSALALIQQRYGQAQAGGMAMANTPDAVLQTVTALPGLLDSPPVIADGERACDMGTPLPAPDASKCTYFWTALAHKASNATGEGRAIEVFILVFHKGSTDQTFTAWAGGASEVAGVRPAGATWVPTLVAVPATQVDAVRSGEYAVGEETGAVYHRIIDATGQATFQPEFDSKEINLMIAPPADGTAASPLVYVYQTTLSF